MIFNILALLWVLLLPQNQNDNITFIDQEGSEVYIQQYEGCYVFIAYWSKRCAPCIKAFRENYDLRESLIREGVVIIIASIDSKDDWNEACKKYKPNGQNVFVHNFETAQEKFEIYSLPMYVSIDPNGNQIGYDRLLRGDILDFADWFSKR